MNKTYSRKNFRRYILVKNTIHREQAQDVRHHERGAGIIDRFSYLRSRRRKAFVEVRELGST